MLHDSKQVPKTETPPRPTPMDEPPQEYTNLKLTHSSDHFQLWSVLPIYTLLYWVLPSALSQDCGARFAFWFAWLVTRYTTAYLLLGCAIVIVAILQWLCTL